MSVCCAPCQAWPEPSHGVRKTWKQLSLLQLVSHKPGPASEASVALHMSCPAAACACPPPPPILTLTPTLTLTLLASAQVRWLPL